MAGFHCTECGVSNAPHRPSCMSAPAPRTPLQQAKAKANHLAKARSYTEAFIAAGESGKTEQLAEAVRDLENAALDLAIAKGAVELEQALAARARP